MKAINKESIKKNAIKIKNIVQKTTIFSKNKIGQFLKNRKEMYNTYNWKEDFKKENFKKDSQWERFKEKIPFKISWNNNYKVGFHMMINQ